MARSLLIGWFLANDSSAVTMVTPALGPSLGVAPSGTWRWNLTENYIQHKRKIQIAHLTHCCLKLFLNYKKYSDFAIQWICHDFAETMILPQELTAFLNGDVGRELEESALVRHSSTNVNKQLSMSWNFPFPETMILPEELSAFLNCQVGKEMEQKALKKPADGKKIDVSITAGR